MTGRTNRTWLLITLLPVLLAAGCGSSPHNNYYILTAQNGKPAAGLKPSLGIGPIEIPEYLNRNGLVYQRQNNSLKIAGSDRWAEPLADGISRVLRLNLAQLLDTQAVRDYPWYTEQAPDFGVKVSILALDATDGDVALTAEWSVYRPSGGEIVSQRISQLHTSLPSAAGPGDLAASYSTLLSELSTQIAAQIQLAQGN